MASMYVVYHGKEGLTRIARHIHGAANILAKKLESIGYKQLNKNYFDTLRIQLPEDLTASEVRSIALEHEINFRYINDKEIGISLDETVRASDLNKILDVFAIALLRHYKEIEVIPDEVSFEKKFERTSSFLDLPVFERYRSETELMRYIKKLEKKDFSLTHSMISLGSCTMKLNAATQLISLSWPELNEIHPFVPLSQTEGYQQLIHELGDYLIKITGMDGISFMPNSGASGEYTGLMVIRKYHEKNGQGHRNLVLIPSSAHGTNPASAVMAGADVVIVKCDDHGNIDIDDLQEKAVANKDRLSAFMVTYPSTHGVFEDRIVEMTSIIHENGGQVYMDGANMNAQVGLTNPAIIGADVCHLNLHKTFAIPHGGGGPGMGPICVMNHLVEFLPTHPVIETGGIDGIDAVAAAPWGSASILAISHAYCKLLGTEGLTRASKYAILNANYLTAALKDHYSVLYKGKSGFVAHEMILDCRKFRGTGISETDVAKRLMDYGFHAPTLSFPVHGTLMVEPTESESLPELERFVEAMISIREEINAVADGRFDATNNVLKNAPHTALETTSDEWNHPYTRKLAAYPLTWIEDNKFWPAVGRLDDAFGDRNLQCSCAAIEAYL
jgi:glycine dehydrogenase